MAIPFKKYGYQLNPITRDIELPQVFLVTKQLKKVGELYPVENLEITINEANQPDEVSFTYYKEVDGNPCSGFDDLVDLSVIQVGDYGFFECEISKNDKGIISKNAVGRSLGHCELSQILATLEINTDEDMGREGEYRYDKNYPTVFYRDIGINDNEEIQKKKKESSLLNRILSYAPHYEIGYVSPTLKNVQRTFSWNDTDLVSILNDVATEISCMFDIQVTINEEGEAARILNAYDMQYCDTCWNALSDDEKMTSDTHEFRNIVNGECQNCHSPESVKDIGLDTGIFISADNLSDDITMVGDKDSIKNCFKVVGGDDLMTATVQGLNMSANNRIMMFSKEQRRQMTTALENKLDEYEADYAENLPAYEELLETQYNIYDIIQYLQSGKMPLLEEEIKTPLEALLAVVKNITTYYKNRFYISRWSNYDYTSAKYSIRNLFTTFMPKGFSFRLDTDDLLYTTDKDYNPKKNYHWYGSIQIYSTDNKEDCVTLYVTQNSGTYIRHGKTDEQISYTDPDNIIGNFSVTFNFADQDQTDYLSYLKQHTEYILSEVDLTYENEKARNWDEYSYNRLESYYDGFQTCIETLDDMPNEIDTTKIDTSTTSSADIIAQMRGNYARIQSHIQSQMSILLDQIFALNTYLGEYSSEFTDADGNVWYQLKNFDTVSDVLAHMVDSNYAGGYGTKPDGTLDETTFTPNQFIGTKPCKCKKCGSINVSVVTDGSNKCNNCGSSEVFTYLDVMEEIKAGYEKNKADHPKSSIVDRRNEMRKKFDLPSYLDDDALYHELLSFIREDVYTNDNYTSDGLTNAQLIRQAKELTTKAKQELSKACVPQYTITAPICAIVGQTAFKYQGVMVEDPYSGFVLNNYIHVQIDDEVYRMRIASISYSFPITDKIDVTFSNVSRYTNGVMSDVASILESAASMATSYSYVATQAEKGQQANDTFDTIKNEGLNAGLMAVKGGRDQDVVIDNHGILLRKKIEEIDDYSKYQMKIINRNIVLTDDDWEDAAMAIGLGTYNGGLCYGVWADLICGDLLVGNKLAIYGGGDGTTDNATVIIDGKGITLDGGAITWTKPIESSAVKGLNECLGVTEITSDSVISPKIGGGYLYIKDTRTTNNTGISVEINPSGSNFYGHEDKYVFNVAKNNVPIMGVTNNGDGYFKGNITSSTIICGDYFSVTPNGTLTAKNGSIGGWEITDSNIYNVNDGAICSIASGTTSCAPGYTTGSYEFHPAYMITAGKTIWNLFKTKQFQFEEGEFTTAYRYADASCDGFCCTNTKLGSSHLFFADTVNSEVKMNGIIKLHADSKFYSSTQFLYCNIDGTCDYVPFLNAGTTQGTSFIDRWISLGNTNCDLHLYARGLFQNDSTAITSDARIKKNIDTLDDFDEFYLSLNPVSFQYITGDSGRTHIGFIAQEVLKSLETNHKTTQDFAGFCECDVNESYYMDKLGYVPDGLEDKEYSLRYQEFIALNTHMIQKLYKEKSEQAEEISALKNKMDNLEKELAELKSKI